MSTPRPATPPRPPTGSGAKSPLTPEQIRRIEINRLKAKALREEREAEYAARNPTSTLSRSNSSMAGQKRSFATFNSQTPATSRDAKTDQASSDRPLDAIQPARNFAKYVEYDFSKMTDTKGGFLTAEDDPHNKALHKEDDSVKPANMTLKEWERQQLLRSLQSRKAGPFEPGINELKREDHNKQCRECGSLEIDWKWEEILKCALCNACKEKFPEKYSLLTKTEAKDDYLLTDRKSLHSQSRQPGRTDVVQRN
jgi:DNA-repair protein complementing XP-A cells